MQVIFQATQSFSSLVSGAILLFGDCADLPVHMPFFHQSERLFYLNVPHLRGRILVSDGIRHRILSHTSNELSSCEATTEYASTIHLGFLLLILCAGGDTLSAQNYLSRFQWLFLYLACVPLYDWRIRPYIRGFQFISIQRIYTERMG
jgi:hypothetical protein